MDALPARQHLALIASERCEQRRHVCGEGTREGEGLTRSGMLKTELGGVQRLAIERQ